MKRTNLLFCVLLLITFHANAQWTLSFCGDIDSTGKCIGSSKDIAWAGEKISVYTMVTNGDSLLGTRKISFKIFDMKNDQAGEIYADLNHYTRPEWQFASKKIYFVKPGYYKVEVYDQDNKRLVTDYLTIMDR